MVSNSLHIELQELLDILGRLQKDFSQEPEYQQLRQELPGDWPM